MRSVYIGIVPGFIGSCAVPVINPWVNIVVFNFLTLQMPLVLKGGATVLHVCSSRHVIIDIVSSMLNQRYFLFISACH